LDTRPTQFQTSLACFVFEQFYLEATSSTRISPQQTADTALKDGSVSFFTSMFEFSVQFT